MSIFAKPETTAQENPYGVKVLFLHGLEGRGPQGKKAQSLSGEWSALCPSLRTQELVKVRADCSGVWSNLDDKKIAKALETPYSDAEDAVRYANPDLIVGSSMGGAILFKLMASGKFSGGAVFCAPAIQSLLSFEFIEKSVKENPDTFRNSVWLLGEEDTVISNKFVLNLVRRVGGTVIFSPSDSHRLNKAVESNILNTAVLTAIELMAAK